MLGVLLPGYWFTRYLAWGDARRAVRWERPAIGLWLVTFVISAAASAWGVFGPDWGTIVGLTGRMATGVGVTVSLLEQIAGVYLTAWFVAWALGNARIGPWRSFYIMTGSFWRTIGYMVAGAAPLMAIHQLMGLGAIGRPVWLVWPMLLLDAGVVAFLALLIAGSAYVAVRHAARRRGVSLDPGESAVLIPAAFAKN